MTTSGCTGTEDQVAMEDPALVAPGSGRGRGADRPEDAEWAVARPGRSGGGWFSREGQCSLPGR